MTSSIICFGDGSFNLQTWIQQLILSHSQGSMLSRFIGDATLILREETHRARLLYGDTTISFSNLQDLWGQDASVQVHPALHAALVVLVQLGSFVGDYETNANRPFPSSQSPCVGFCLGEISAAVVAHSQSLLHVVELGQFALRAAFRIGLLAAHVRQGIEFGSSTDSWSLALDQSLRIDNEFLDRFHQSERISPTKSVWIGYTARKTVSIFGPPSSLQRLLSYVKQDPRYSTSTFVQQVAIHAPYHATHLYSEAAIRCALAHIPGLGTRARPQIATSAQSYASAQGPELLTTLGSSILAQPMDWNIGVNNLRDRLENDALEITDIRAFGPGGMAQQLASALEPSIKVPVIKSLDPMRGQTERSKPKQSPVAIVGMAVRLPGATNVDEMWSALMAGKDFAQPVPKDRFDPATHLRSSAFGCFIDNAGHFDAKFFNISPREAAQTDPGHRLAMITALEAMENAGMVVGRTPSTQSSRIGTFYGQTVDEYKEQNMALSVDTYYIPGSLRAFAPGRLNYFFKFGGPAYAIDTACSSGAVAINLACRSIWSGECDTVLAGGINTLCGCDNFNGLLAGKFLSPTGNCKTFDHNADGYCRAEGICSLVLKRLDAAQADQDNILGVIASTVTNFSAEAASITRPHGPTQESLYRSVVHEAGLRPADINYVELHGTGTQAGDQVETSSVMNVFAPEADSLSRSLYLSAIKPNLGHSEAASGPTSLIKAIQVLQRGQLPPHVGIKGVRNQLLPDFESRRVCVSKDALPYPRPARGQRRAVVSNFSAAGGCTAFVIEEAPKQASFDVLPDTRSQHPVCISGKSKTAMGHNAERLSRWLDQNPDSSLADVSYTSSARRSQYSWRKTFTAANVKELKSQLAALDVDGAGPRRSPRPVFIFTGQGSWYPSVGRKLLDTCAVFRQSILSSLETCRALGLPSFEPLMTDEAFDASTASPAQSHLCIVAVEMALFHLWKSWGVPAPAATMGHSLGEYTALCAAGVLSARDALYLVGKRAELLEKHCAPGTHKMLAVSASISDLEVQMTKDVEVACKNGPNDTVLSGPVEAITKLKSTLTNNNTQCRQLDLPFGFHSAQIEPILEPFAAVLQQVTFSEPLVPVASTLLGQVVSTGRTFEPQYLLRQCREAVDFSGALGALQASELVDAETVWLELGPQPLCSRMVTKTLGSDCFVLHSLKKGTEDWSSLCSTAAALHDTGMSVDWQHYHSDFEAGLSLVNLPTYAFEMKKHWIPYNNFLLNRSPPVEMDERSRQGSIAPAERLTTSLHTMIKSSRPSKDQAEMVFETALGEEDIHGAIMGHAVHGIGLCPASIYGDIALTIGKMFREQYDWAGSTDAMDIGAMTITKPITVPRRASDTDAVLQVRATGHFSSGTINMEFSLRGDRQPRATCILAYGAGSEWRSQWSRGVQHHAQRGCELLEANVAAGGSHKMQRGMVYKLFAAVVDYDAKYQAMQEVTMNSAQLEASARLQLYQGTAGGSYFCSPFWVDAIVHLAGFVMNANETVDTRQGVFISGGWDRFKLAEAVDPTQPYRVYVKMVHVTSSLVAGDVVLMRDGQVVGMVENLRFQRVPPQLLLSILQPGVAPEAARASTSILTPPPSRRPTLPSLDDDDAPGLDKSRAPDVLSLLADEVGVPADELSEEAELASLGVDSLLGLAIAERLRGSLGLAVDGEALLGCATIGQLQDMIREAATRRQNDESDGEGASTTSSRSVSAPATPDARDAAMVVSSARHILAHQIGVEQDELQHCQALSELGVDSLLSWSISNALQQELGVEISADELCGKMTVQSFEARLLAPPAAVSPPPASAAADDEEADAAPRPPLQLHRGSGQHQVFLFPDGGGSAAAYAAVPAIDQAWSTWALSMGDQPGQHATIERLAERWVAQVQAIQPQGPYRLAGWSAGGFFALEAARRLLQSGHDVDRLVLIDSPSPERYEPMPLALLETVVQHGVVGGGAVALDSLRQRFHSTIGALQEYRPQPLAHSAPGRRLPLTTLVWATDGLDTALPTAVAARAHNGSAIADWLLSSRCGRRALDGWERLLAGCDVDVLHTPGHHFGLVRPPYSTSLRHAMRRALITRRNDAPL